MKERELSVLSVNSVVKILDMAKVGRGNKAIEDLEPELRAQVDARLDVGQSPTEVYREVVALQEAMELRTWQEYATTRRRECQIQIARDERALLDGLLDLAEVDRARLNRVQQFSLGAALRELMTSGKGTVRLNAINAVAAIREDQRRQESHQVVMERFDAWKADHLRIEQERLNEANRKTERLGRDEGLSPSIIAKIREIYGLDAGSAGDGAAA